MVLEAYGSISFKGVLIALFVVSIILVIVAGSKKSEPDSPTPTVFPTAIPTPQITPFTQDMFEQGFLPADHTISINELVASTDFITTKPGESVEFNNVGSLPITVNFLGVNQDISALGSYEVLLEIVGIYPYEISINNSTYSGTVIVGE